MQNNLDLTALAAVNEKAASVVCFIHPQATYDAVAAALSLRLAFKEAGKSCDVVCEEPMRVEFSRLIDIDQIQTDAGNRNLVLSFAYSEEQVDKVSYNVDEDNQRFELVITPKSGGQPLDPSTIDFRRSGLAGDIIFLFGYHSLAELGAVYEREKYAIDSAYTVAVTQNKIPPYAKLHLTLQPEQLSYSELVYFVVRQLQLAEVKDDLATNLLSGVEYATDRLLQPNLSPRTFETVANLLRRGGRRDANNPAFQFLGQPIRQSSAATYPEPAWSAPQSSRPATLSGNLTKGVSFGGAPEPDFAQNQPGAPLPQAVSPSDFARAMSSRS